MKAPGKRVIIGVPAGLLLLVLLFFVWLVRGPFFLGFSPETNVTPILNRDNPRQMLQTADHFSWLLNTVKAGPLYQRAQILFTKEGDARDALYAKIGYIRSQAETMPFVNISSFLADQLQTSLVQQNPRLRLWCLTSKGYTDIEIDVAEAQKDWEEARILARRLGEGTWANRATGELGLIAFLEGNPLRAARMVGVALITARATGDIGGEIRYLELLGDGFKEIDRQYEALAAFNKAIALARVTPDAGFPFMSYEGKPTHSRRCTALGKLRLCFYTPCPKPNANRNLAMQHRSDTNSVSWRSRPRTEFRQLSIWSRRVRLPYHGGITA
jgi:hypothetical protein